MWFRSEILLIFIIIAIIGAIFWVACVLEVVREDEFRKELIRKKIEQEREEEERRKRRKQKMKV